MTINCVCGRGVREAAETAYRMVSPKDVDWNKYQLCKVQILSLISQEKK
jgi:hypothetical protein